MKIDYGDAVSDVLTTVLNALQFQGKVFCYTKLTAPWALRLKRKDYAHFHFFDRGLDKLGANGWELVAVAGPPTDPAYYFKRRK
jgi:Cupin